MSDGKTHDLSIWATAPWVGLGVYAFAPEHKTEYALVAIAGHLMGGLMLSPDLDLPSRPWRRWGWFRIIMDSLPEDHEASGGESRAVRRNAPQSFIPGATRRRLCDLQRNGSMGFTFFAGTLDGDRHLLARSRTLGLGAFNS